MLKEKTLPLKRYDYCSSSSLYMGTIIVILVCQILISIIVLSVSVSQALVGGGNGVDLATNGDFSTGFMIFVQLACAGFIAAFSAIRKYRFNFNYFKHEETKKPPTVCDYILPIVAAVVLFIGMYLPTMWYGYFNVHVLGIPEDAGAINIETVSAVVMIVIASVFLAPICEETIYRGVLLHGLKDGKKTIAAVMLSALAFTLMHMSPLQVVYQFALGVLSAFIALKTKKLLPSILLHGASNAVALIVEFTPLSEVMGGCSNWLVSHGVAAFFITLGLFIGSGALLFVIVRFGFSIPQMIANRRKAKAVDTEVTATTEDESVDGEAVEAVEENSEVKRIKRVGATVKFWLSIGICGIVFIISLVSLMVG